MVPSSPPPSLPPRSRWRRRAGRALVWLAGLFLLYLAAANLFLNTPLGPWALNLRPQRLRVSWTSAWSLYPGDVRVRGLRLRGDASRARWRLDVERGRGWIDLLALVGREFRVVGFEGWEVRSTTLRKPSEPESAAEREEDRRPHRRGWILDFRRVRLHHVREIALDSLHLVGDSEVAGAFHEVIGGRFTLEPSTLKTLGATLRGDPRELARGVDVAAEVRIAPYAPRRYGGVLGFDFVSGTLRARGRTVGLRLPGTPTPAPLPAGSQSNGAAGTSPGPAQENGELLADLRLDRGRIHPGSRLAFAAPGTLTAALEVGLGARPVLTLDATFHDFAFGGPRDGPPLFRSTAATLRSSTPETRLSRLLAEARQLREAGGVGAGRWLGQAQAEGVDLQSYGLRRSWQIHLDRGSAGLDLPALLRREVVLVGLRGQGAALHLQFAGRSGPPGPPSASPWALRLEDAQITGGREARFNDAVLRGDLTVGGSFARGRTGVVEVAGVTAEIARGQLVQGEEPLARDLDLALQVRLPPLAPGESPWSRILGAASGSLRGSGRVVSLPASRRSGAPGGAGREVAGALNFDLHLDRGQLGAGSQMALTLPRIPGLRSVAFAKPLFLAGSVDAGAQGPELHFGAEAAGLTVAGASGETPLVRVASGRFSTTSRELRLDRLIPALRSAEARLPEHAPRGLVGEVAAQGVEVAGAAVPLAWHVTAERVATRIDLSRLAERQLALDGLLADGISVQLGPRPSGRSRPPARTAPQGPGAWSIAVAGARLTGIRSFAQNGNRLIAGPTGAAASGGLLFSPQRGLEIHDLALDADGARIDSGRETVARPIDLRVRGVLGPEGAEGSHGLAFLRRVSGSAKIQGHVGSLGFLHRYLKAPWLEVRGQGDLDADFRLEAGRLLPGSRVAIAQGELQASFLDRVASGHARLVGTVGGGGGDDHGRGRPSLHLRATFDGVSLTDEPAAGTPAAPPYVRGKGLTIDVLSTDLDLSTPVSDLRAAIDLPRAEVPDLRIYNAYLPAAAGLEILSGTGSSSLHLDLDGTKQSGRGRLELASDDLRLRFQEVELGGRLSLQTQLASRDLKKRSFLLGGTRLDLDRVTYTESGDGTKSAVPPGAPWWAHLRLIDGEMTWGKPLSLRSTAELDMKDSGLLLTLFAQRRNFLRWFESLLRVENVTAHGLLRLSGGTLEVDPLRVEGGKLDLRSRLRLSRDHRWGDLYVRYGRLATGIALRDGKRDWKIRSPEAWFVSREGWDGPAAVPPAGVR
jgi:hypothetical protein